MSKLVFFDIDGTLLDSEMQVPESTMQALHRLKENGHKIAICSGRPYSIIYPFLLELGFDGVVASAGAYIRKGNDVIYHSTLEQSKLQELVDLFDRHGAAYFLQGYPGRFLTAASNAVMAQALSGGKTADSIRKDMVVCENPAVIKDLECGVYFHADATVDELQKELDARTDGYFKLTGCSFGDDIIFSGEMTKRGVNKATGMQRLLDSMGLSREDSVAFGDGSNDYEMIEYAETGVVMGNGLPGLKAQADYVTTDIHADGIWNGLKHLDLI